MRYVYERSKTEEIFVRNPILIKFYSLCGQFLAVPKKNTTSATKKYSQPKITKLFQQITITNNHKNMTDDRTKQETTTPTQTATTTTSPS
jgi:hypothetical protein